MYAVCSINHIAQLIYVTSDKTARNLSFVVFYHGLVQTIFESSDVPRQRSVIILQFCHLLFQIRLLIMHSVQFLLPKCGLVFYVIVTSSEFLNLKFQLSYF